MQSSASSYFFLFFPIFFISLWALISFLISYVGGWHSLAQQFRNDGPVYGERYRWQAAGMRWTARYNGCLTISADIHGLNLSTNILFRIAHPPLFIPWSEITLTRKRVFFSHGRISLARQQRLPFTIHESLANKTEARCRQFVAHGNLTRANLQDTSALFLRRRNKVFLFSCRRSNAFLDTNHLTLTSPNVC